MQASPRGSEYRDGVISVVPETDGILAVCLEGEFDLRSASSLGDDIDRALQGGKHVIIDLSEATFIDSSVINMLVRASKRVNGSGQAFVLQLGTAAVVERALDIAGIDRVMPRTRSRIEAVQIIQARGLVE